MKKRYLALLLIIVSAIQTAMADNYDKPYEGIGLLDSSRVFDLDEVVVITQPKEAFRLRRQPISSSVFSDNELTLLGVRDLRELSGYVPSFVMPGYGSRLTSSMYIRGIGSRVNSPAVGMYVDGIPLVSKNSYNFHTYQLERVDVLRGPQGTLYGMNTEGGLVRLYSKNPMRYQGTDVILGAGSHFYRNVEAAHYNKVCDNIAFSVAGFYNGQDGFFRNSLTDKKADSYNEAGGKFRLMYNPSNRLSMDYMADYQYVRQNGFPYGSLDVSSGKVASPETNRQGNYRRNMLNTGLNLQYAADAFIFNSTTSYQYLKDYMMMDQDYTSQDFMHLEQRQFQNALTQELTFKSNGSGRWQWTTGAYGSYQWLRTSAPVYFDEAFTSRISGGIQSAMYAAMVRSMADRMIASGTPADIAESAAKAAIERAGGVGVSTEMSVPSLFHTPQFNIGIYHESNIRILDRLIATIGLRYDFNHVEIDYDTNASMTVTANVMGQTATNVLCSVLGNIGHDNHRQLLPKIGLSYKLADDGSNVYATVSKGYRAGGFNIQMFSDILQSELNANSAQAMRQSYDIPHTDDDYERIRQAISYKPEESWNYELGAHLNLLGNKVHADIAAYYMQIRNQQLSVMAGNYGFGRMMVNAGKSYSCGVELSLRGNAIGDRFSWMASYGLTHSVFKEYSDEIEGSQTGSGGKQDVVEVDYSGKRVPFVPMHTLGLNADYRWPIGGSVLQAITIGANMSAQGRIYWDEANTYSQPFYALLGAHVDAELGRSIVLSLWSRNITDTRYSSFAFDSSATGKKEYFAQRGNPFQIGIDLRLHL